MNTIILTDTNHDFQKLNLVTQSDRNGQFDEFKCKNCGLSGKVRTLGELQTKSERKSVSDCPKAKKVNRVKIRYCSAHGEKFSNLVAGSIHDVIDSPDGKDDSRGVWVMGVGEPVKVLFNEYQKI